MATDKSESPSRILNLALLDKITGSLGEEEETNAENDSPEELYANGDSVGARVGTALSAIDNAVGQEDTDGDFQISVTDAGPKILSLGTATSNGFKTFDIRVSSVSVLSTS